MKYKKFIVLLSLICVGIPFLSVFPQSKIIIRPTISQSQSHNLWLRPTQSFHRPKVGVVLSGGGGRGLAQIGVLRVLEQNHIPIDLIVGNSLGSVVGGLYAAGYSIAEIESLALHTNWVELLSFSEETKRTDLFVGQKQTHQEGYFSIRFNGLEPIIPSSISGGQRLSNFFSYLTLQALYHPNPSFDDLKIPLRVIATDIVSGKRVVIESGSLSEAMRASVTVPLLYAPLEKDSMFMVDGGLTSNIPVDVAKSLGCDIVIVVNSTSSMRKSEQLKAPWEIADQIMTIMMQESNRQQLKLADVVITPETGERIVSDFSGIDTLIKSGEVDAQKHITQIKELLDEPFKFYYDSLQEAGKKFDTIESFKNFQVPLESDSITDLCIRRHTFASEDSFSVEQFRYYLDYLGEDAKFKDLYAEINSTGTAIDVALYAKLNSPIKRIEFSGNSLVTDNEILRATGICQGRFFKDPVVIGALENVLSLYRKNRYSLTRIDSIIFVPETKTLFFKINEGRIADIQYIGNDKTRSYIIRREFPLDVGNVFNIDQAARGIVNIKSTGLFDYVLLDVQYQNNEPVIVLKVKEKSSELLRLGFHADDEHGIVSTVDIRDANFRGAWEDFGVVMRYGFRDRFIRTEYTVNRIFHSYFTFGIQSYYKSRDILTYHDDPPVPAEHWERIEAGKYREIKYGGSFTFGSHFKRFGDFTAEMRLEGQKINVLSGDGPTLTIKRFASIKLQSIIDTQDKFSFPTGGMILSLMFESASKNLGSDIGFGKVGFVYDNYITFLPRHTFRSKFTFGFADQTLPITEQYSLGGKNSFLGLREDDSRGRQLLVANLEYRFRLPFKLIFETYLKARYDLGTISEVPEELKFNHFHHGVGVELALDTPIGPASFAIGKSFYLGHSLPNSPIAVGPMLLYFSVGPSL